jgi:hypothetical protein
MTSRNAVPATQAVPVGVRVLATWTVIFPEAVLANWLLSQFDSTWNGYIQTALLTAVVIPPAVTVLVPLLLRWYVKLTQRWRSGS